MPQLLCRPQDLPRIIIEIHRNQEVYDLPEPLRDKLRAAIISKCKETKKSGLWTDHFRTTEIALG